MFPLPEQVTIWLRTGSDGLGGITWSAPVTYDARIAYSQQKFTDINGDTVVSSAVCYTEAPVTAEQLRDGVYAWFGESTAVAPPAAADDVRALSHTPSGAGDLRKLWFA